MKRFILTGIAICSSLLFAMPTQKELEGVQSIVRELMDPVVEEFRTKKKTALDVAVAAEMLAGEASSEAAKFLLLRGAVSYYSRAGEYDKAADAVNSLRLSVKDIPASVLSEIIYRATNRVGAKKAPRLYALHQALKEFVCAEKNVSRCTAALSSDPNNTKARRTLAESYAVLGDWPKALEEFSKVRGETARIARGEKSGSVAVDKVAAFWWDYKFGEEGEITVFRRHSAGLYRKALDQGLLDGLSKALAERRIAETEKAPEVPMVAVSAESVPRVGTKSRQWHIPSRFNAPLIKSLKLENGAEIEFCACPPGKFKMSNVDGKGVHDVTITRPFWIGTQFFSEADVCALRDDLKSDLEYSKKMFPDFAAVIIPKGEGIKKHCASLNEKYGESLPEGYVFRLPSEAELEYAVTCGRGLRKDEGEYQMDHLFTIESFNAKGYDGQKVHNKRLRLFPKKSFNKWGLSGVAWLFSSQVVLDTVDSDKSGAVHDDEIAYALKETDPVRFGEKMLGREKCVRRHVKRSLGQGYFRLVIGPDLVSERKRENSGN